MSASHQHHTHTNPSTQPIRHIVIVGLGVVGGSFAKAIQLKAPGQYHVYGIDPDTATLEEAQKLGVIEAGEPENQTLLQRADLVVICLYPSQVLDFVQKYRNDFKEGAILTDVTGIKQAVMDLVIPHIPPQVDFIFGHPMAGRESQGFAYSDGTVFTGANYILTLHKANLADNVERFKAFIQQLGFSRISELSAKKHDEMIAYTSQLCHVIATSLINTIDEAEDVANYVGDSYKELTRISKLNAPLWSELMLDNREALLEMMELFEATFDRFKAYLQTENEDAIEDFFHDSTQQRLKLERNLASRGK